MTEINTLPEQASANVSDNDRIPMWSATGSAPFTRYVTRASLLNGVAFADGDFDFGTSQISNLTAVSATISQATITGSLEFDDASTIATAIHTRPSLTVPDVLSGAAQTVTTTMTGAETDDHLQCSFDAALPDGITAQAWISASDTVSVKFYNTTTSTVSGFSVDARLHFFRLS